MNLSLEGKNALVCGSTQGIGLAIAVELALLGANCTLLARNEQVLKGAVASLDTSLGQHHAYLVADFSHPNDLRNVITNYVKSQPVHILINNTGGPPGGPIIEAEESAFLTALNQHLICNHILAKAVIPGMKEAKYGRIINIISTSVKVPLRNLGVSNTTRAAVASWAKTLSNEISQFGITVNNILPGLTNTGRLSSLIESVSKKMNITSDDVAKDMISEVPMKRFAESPEIAAMAAFLATPAASYVNGTSIPVDGGRTGSI